MWHCRNDDSNPEKITDINKYIKTAVQLDLLYGSFIVILQEINPANPASRIFFL